MRQQSQYSTGLEQHIVVIFHISGARAIFLLFCDHQDTESESCEMEISISEPIFTHKNISKALWENGIHTILDVNLFLWFFIFLEIEPVPYYFVFAKKLSLSN